MNTAKIGQRTKCKFSIEHNGIVYNLGVMIPGSAMKKAHLFVRKWVLKEWQRTLKNNETTAMVMADGLEYASVYGYHKNRSVQSITL